MAGGMNVPRGRPSLAERSRASLPVAAATGTPTGTPTSAAALPSSRHCWVSGLAEHPGRWPGLVLEWRKVTPSVWQGRVVYAIHDGRQTVLIEAWLSGACLEPAP